MRASRSIFAAVPLLFLGCAPKAPSQCPCQADAPAAAPAPAPHAHHEHEHQHEHQAGQASAPEAAITEARVVPHAGLRTFENSGNSLVGVATRSLGSQEVEVWRSSIAVGSRTPVHTHDGDEVFIVLTGSGVLHVGEQTLPFAAPATVIAPAGVAHWVENTGPVPTDQIVVVRVGSAITGADGRVMDLPWRR